MKSSLYVAIMAVAIGVVLAGCSKSEKAAEPEPVIEIKTEGQKTGYGIGVDNGQNLRNQFQGMTVDLKSMAQGFSDELNARPRKFSEEEIGRNVESMRKIITEKANIKIEADKAGYSIGVDHARALRQQFQGSDIDPAALAQGFSDEIHGRPKKISDEDIRKVIETMRSKMIEQMMAEGMKSKAEKNPDTARNLEEGKKFLEENAKKEGVKTTASGLQYIVVREGDGPQPKITDRVTAHYQGSLLNGKVFDSSYVRNRPLTFGLKEVIKGWTEGLQLMKVGSKFKLFIPADLAYGEMGAPGMIGPNSTLIFEVELIKIEDGK